MPLLIGGKTIEIAQDVIRSIFRIGNIKTASEQVLHQETRTVDSQRLLCVNQREFAATLPSDENIDIIGSEDATTCHIIILRHAGSGATCLAHCDGCDTENGIRKMISVLQKLTLGSPDGRIELHMVGGFLDNKRTSIKLSEEIIKTFTEQEEQIHLITAAISDLNDTVKDSTHFPIIYGIGVNVKTGEIFRATFPEKGPAMDVRSACHFAGCDKLMNIYDHKTGELTIGPYQWNPWPQVQQWLNVPNAFIRRYMSTSPEQEPEYFEDHVRAALKVLHEHPYPHETLFCNKNAWRYKKQQDGSWLKK